jgi:regulator of replication initiation timing
MKTHKRFIDRLTARKDQIEPLKIEESLRNRRSDEESQSKKEFKEGIKDVADSINLDDISKYDLIEENLTLSIENEQLKGQMKVLEKTITELKK